MLINCVASIIHTSQVQEMPDRKGKCKGKPCRKGYFTVNDKEDQCK